MCRAQVAAVVLLAAAMGASCAGRQAPPVAVDPWPETVAQADADVREGCYHCLARALEAYESGLQQGHTDVGSRAYRTAVDLAVRERLIGVYPGPHQEAPARLAPHAGGDDAAAGEDVLHALPWRRGTLGVGMGLPVGRVDVARARTRRVALTARADDDPWSATLLLALMATNPFLAVDEGERMSPTPPALAPALWAARHPDDASLGFTKIALLRGSVDDVLAFRAAHQSFDETDVALGEAELARGRLVSADEAFDRALATLPSLMSVLALRADLRQRMEDLPVALELYERLLTHVPDHREGLLGQLKTLGFSGRHEEAIAVADRMVTLGTWYIGEAHYWKAWNLFTLGRLDAARASVDDARTLMVNADVSYLGGVIAFRQQRLDDAQRDFDAAIELEGRHCEAHFDRAALRLTRRTWDEAASGFDEAYACLTARTSELERRIADAREARLTDDARTVLIARRERALRDHRYQIAWSRYNSGVAYANVGKYADARSRADEAIAIGGPAAEAAQRLLPQLP